MATPPSSPDMQEVHSHHAQGPSPPPAIDPPLDADGPAPSSAGRTALSRLAAAAATAQPAPFLTKTYDLVDDEGTDSVISWNPSGDGFIVWDVQMLCQRLLPRLFRHSNFASFVRQLNIYGFRKTDLEQWQFANCDFVRGQRHRLRCIHRKKTANAGAFDRYHWPQYAVRSPSSSMLVPDSDDISEVRKHRITERLDMLQSQVCRLRQRLHQTEKECQALWQHLQMSKRCEQHMMEFIVKAIHDPSFLTNLAQESAAESLQVPKRRRLAAAPTFALEGSHRMDMADVGCASGVYDAGSPDQPAYSVSESVHESPRQLPLYPLREQESDESAESPASTQASENSSQEGVVDKSN